MWQKIVAPLGPITLQWKKNDLTTGAWQHNIGCPISIVLLSTSDVHALRLNHSLAMESQSTQDATKFVTQILDAKYQKADILPIVRDNCKHLSANQQNKLQQLLKKY